MPAKLRRPACPTDAASNRRRARETGVFIVNVVGGLGSGKTTLVRAALGRLAGLRRVGLITASPPASYGRDRAAGPCADADAAAVLQVPTRTRPWVTAAQVGEALDLLPLDELDILLVESVGAHGPAPAAPDLGEDATVCVLSVVAAANGGFPGHRRCCRGLPHLLVLNKIDLLPALGFDRRAFGRRLGGGGAAPDLIETSAHTGEGVGQVVDWLLDHAPARYAQAPPAQPGGAHAQE